MVSHRGVSRTQRKGAQSGKLFKELQRWSMRAATGAAECPESSRYRKPTLPRLRFLERDLAEIDASLGLGGANVQRQ